MTRKWSRKPNSKVPSYVDTHRAISFLNGRALDWPCHHCGEQAREWAYDKTDPEEISAEHPRTGRLQHYSLDVERYMPLCVACYRDFDKPDRTHSCTRGHLLAEVGVYVAKRRNICRQCAKDDNDDRAGYRRERYLKEHPDSTAGQASFWSTRTRCHKGHEFSPENTRMHKSRPNVRVCRACQKIAMDKHFAKRKAAAVDGPEDS